MQRDMEGGMDGWREREEESTVDHSNNATIAEEGRNRVEKVLRG